MNGSEKHLELIQAVITRLSNNSYAYKGWTITVAAGLVAFISQKHPGIAIAAIYPVIAFWFLDGFCLAVERAYRRLYERSRLGENKDFSMSLAGIRNPVRDQINAMLSGTLLLFYISTSIFVYIVAGTLK